jgi:hypothetical protein
LFPAFAYWAPLDKNFQKWKKSSLFDIDRSMEPGAVRGREIAFAAAAAMATHAYQLLLQLGGVQCPRSAIGGHLVL